MQLFCQVCPHRLALFRPGHLLMLADHVSIVIGVLVGDVAAGFTPFVYPVRRSDLSQ